MDPTQRRGAGDVVLDGKVAVVTGASRGLGRAVARRLAACGCDVVLNYVHADDAAEAALKELDDLPGKAIAVKGDVRTPDALLRLLDEAHDRFGRLDIFVHNAMTWQPMSAVAPDVQAFSRAQELALNPLLYGSAELAKRMSGPGGRVVVISSNGAARVIPGYVAVGVAKAALESLVRYLAVELAGHGIAVNAIATALLDKDDGGAPEDIKAMLAARTPAGRLTRCDDVAAAVALLCAEEAGWIHGQVIMVDGGLSLRA